MIWLRLPTRATLPSGPEALSAACDQPDSPFQFAARQKHAATTLIAAQANIRAQPEDTPGIRPAGVRLFEGQHVVDLKINRHRLSSLR